MDDEKKERTIRFGFSCSDLLGNVDSRRYDVEACARRYAALCERALRQAYPDHEIEILFDSDLRTQVDGLSDSPEVDVVRQICDKVYQDLRWEVPRPWLDPVSAHERFDIPISLIRWACNEGLIREAEKTRGYWEFPQEAFLEVKRIPAFTMSKEVLLLSATEDDDKRIIESCSYDQVDAYVAKMSAPVELLVVLPSSIEHPPWFTKDNTLVLLRIEDRNLTLEVEHFVDAVQWKNTAWTYDAFAKAMVSQANQRTSVKAYLDEVETYSEKRIDGAHFAFSRIFYQGQKLHDLICNALNDLEEIAKDSEIELAGGPRWRIEYEKKGNEGLFCQEVLGPLLRRMGFLDVRYTHGAHELGKDFTFSEMTRFNELRHCALQAKAGDIRGGIKSEIDELLSQIEDAFGNPYYELGDENPRYISTFVIAISGNFTDNAKVKIRNNMRRTIIGSVHFLDKERILDLISHYWSSK